MIYLVAIAKISNAGPYRVSLLYTILDNPGTDITTGTGHCNGAIGWGYGFGCIRHVFTLSSHLHRTIKVPLTVPWVQRKVRALRSGTGSTLLRHREMPESYLKTWERRTRERAVHSDLKFVTAGFGKALYRLSGLQGAIPEYLNY